jgi:hypothetical protein
MGYCSKTVKNYNPVENTKPQEDNIQNVDE